MSQPNPPATPPPDGPILAVSAAEHVLTVVVCQRGLVLSAFETAAPGQAMRALAPAMDRLLGQAGLHVRDLSGVACVRGPGSFTGIRVALATCLGLRLGAGLPLAGLDLLPLLARQDAPAGHDGQVLVLLPSRRDRVFAQAFAGPAKDRQPLCPPFEAATTQAAAEAAALSERGPLLLAGRGALVYRQLLTRAAPKAFFPDPAHDRLGPAALALAAHGADYARRPVAPLYISESDATANLAALAAARGLPPERARALYDQAVSAPAV